MSLDLSRIRALCFDVDGTLSDTDDQFVRKLIGWLRPVSFAFRGRDPRPFARRVVMATETPGNLLFGLPDRLGFDGALATMGDWVYRAGLGRAPAPFLIIAGIKEMLERLHPYYPLSVVSARGRLSTLAFLNQFEILPFFQCVATAQTCRHTKPFPDPILWAAAQMGAPPDACLMIGDTTIDLRAGKAAGAQTAGVLCGFGEEKELRCGGADVILKSTAELPDVLLPGADRYG
jgi:phosphoglycolate phosphatase-like HAD superfamily hydrolase